MPVNLTPNAIAIINGGDVNSKPLVQVVDIKQIGSAQERYRLLISDSTSTQHAMLATQLNDRVKDGSVKKGSVIQLIDYICSEVQKRKYVCLISLIIINYYYYFWLKYIIKCSYLVQFSDSNLIWIKYALHCKF